MNEIAINVNHVSKIYKLYDNPKDRLKEAFGLSHKKRYREHYALNDVSFQVGRGETVGIIGTNGSGKSTILKIVTGVLNQTQGDVEIQGRISALLELGAGFNMEYTGLENVYLNGAMIGFSREEIDAKLDDILGFADIGEFIHQPVKTYSSGMFIRLAFAVAINIDPEILIVDEALSVGDVFFQAKCYKKFEDFKKLGKTILFVSHDLSSISKYCDRVILLNKGTKLAEGDPKEIVDMYKRVLVGQEALPQETEEKKQEQIYTNVLKDNLPINPNTQEYGNKKAIIYDFAIIDKEGNITGTLNKGDEFTVLMKVRFQEAVREPIFAFTIKNVKGIEITGTNTAFEKVYVEPAKAGEERVIRFTQKIDLQGDQYLLSLGCTAYEGDDFVVYHRLYDVTDISVVSDKNSVGFYDMNSSITIE